MKKITIGLLFLCSLLVCLSSCTSTPKRKKLTYKTENIYKQLGIENQTRLNIDQESKSIKIHYYEKNVIGAYNQIDVSGKYKIKGNIMTIYPEEIVFDSYSKNVSYERDEISKDKQEINFKILTYNDYEIFLELVSKIEDDETAFLKAIKNILHMKSKS